MNRSTGAVLTISSIVMLLFIGIVAFHLDFWLLKPEQKFAEAWRSDMHLLEQSRKLPPEWKEIREISVKGQASPVTEWISQVSPPIQATKDGRYRLNVFVIHWLEGYRYGVVIQYDLIDLKTQNTVSELGRTLKLGFVY